MVLGKRKEYGWDGRQERRMNTHKEGIGMQELHRGEGVEKIYVRRHVRQMRQ